MLTDDQVKELCMKRDEANVGIVYYIGMSRRTFALEWQSISWHALSEGEKWCMVKYGNIFDTLDDCTAAINRALNKP